ncbi:dihydrofolate reductase family protein [Ureibacillus sp. 179-F W5.1 NHS]|uniref:Dihydrofolate reductase n=1 Tax=Lysinibacillus halotolerans TaxID=1368476 RepID=A0A3M8H422_9BACI|nr:dihydrofolate reductase family protein [Lysinibacillus halotolerans]RNC97191.1 dihydrofolate reductase [Lysinibacillus halotolerans]
MPEILSRKVLLDLAVSLDGFIEGQNGEIDWCIMDEEMGFNNFLNQIDTIFYGRKSYDLWGESTPDIEDVDLQKQMESIHTKKKYVFSRTQKGTDQKAVYINENILEEVEKIKSQSGKDIWLYGGSSLITTFMNLGLVDELRLSVHPVILGEGKPLFVNIKQRLNLNLVDTRRFSSGVVQLIYHLK